MHILFLTDNFPPEVNAPANRTFEHCRVWVEKGHQVTVITCAPNFPKGKVFAGYRNRVWQSEEMAGIRVIRVWSYIAANKGKVRRTLDYLSFMGSAIVASPLVKSPDLVVATSPQFFTAIAGYVVGVLRRVPFVFELRDLWPVSIQAVGAMKGDSPGLKAISWLEMFLYRKAKRIVSVTHSFSRILVGRGVDATKIDVVTNGVILSRFQPQAKDPELEVKYGLQGKFVAGYIGTHGLAHALEVVLETAAELQNRGEGDEIHFVLLGDGARKEALVDKARKMQLKNVTFIDTVPRDEVKRYWSLLDASIIHLKKDRTFRAVIPSKLFECMAMGIPVLHGVQGESAEIVEDNKIGLAFEPENADQLATCLERLRQDEDLYVELRQNCLSVARKYERRNLAERMLESLEIAVSSDKVSRRTARL